MVLSEPIQITKIIARALEELKIQYFVGGSLASSLHGIPRATQDVDIIADIQKEHIDSLVAILKNEFYIDKDMIMEAIKRNASFNMIYLKTMFKVDIFVFNRDRLSIEEAARKEKYRLSEDPLDDMFLASAEDVILHKLYWYKIGGCVSERQWNDVLGVLQVQSKRLDHVYLQNGSQERGVSDLLEKAIEEAQSNE